MKYNFYFTQLAEPKEVSFQALNTVSILRGETIPISCTYFFLYKWNNPQKLYVSKYFQKRILLKQISRNGTIMLKGEKFYSIFKDSEPNRLEILFQGLFFKSKKYWKKLIYWGKNYRSTELMPTCADSISEFFVLGAKSESSQKFLINGVWSGLKYI
jgi:hypothetical protein